VLEMLRHSLCDHVVILSEAAGIIFGGGFPRHDNPGVRCAAQLAIYHVQSPRGGCTRAMGHCAESGGGRDPYVIQYSSRRFDRPVAPPGGPMTRMVALEPKLVMAV
jgi:hypothetical protein